MAGQEGFEPPACGFGDRRSIQLELLTRKLVGGGGIEPRARREPGYSRSQDHPALLSPTHCAAPGAIMAPRTRRPLFIWPTRAGRCAMAHTKAITGRETRLSGYAGGHGRSRTRFERFCKPLPSPIGHVTVILHGMHNKEVHPISGVSSKIWSGHGESNPGRELGRLLHSRYAIPAWRPRFPLWDTESHDPRSRNPAGGIKTRSAIKAPDYPRRNTLDLGSVRAPGTPLARGHTLPELLKSIRAQKTRRWCRLSGFGGAVSGESLFVSRFSEDF